jgi:hypothetical protein
MNMNALADRVRRLAASNPPWLSAAVRRELQFLGENNLANKSAVSNLIAMGKAGDKKVGHHGSLNATPRQWVWEAFKKKKDRQLEAMMSTMSGKHGKKSSNTEVTRRTLVTALLSGSQLKNTQELKGQEIVNITTIKPAGA